jgi:CheY-like chemotaxis protein
VLVVDDNADSAQSLAALLSIQGHQVRTAVDGAEGLDVAESFRPDVVVLDLGMPGMDGYETARRLRARPWAGSVLLLALTGWSQDEDRSRSREAGFDEHLVKPVDPERLAHVVQRAGRASAGRGPEHRL